MNKVISFLYKQSFKYNLISIFINPLFLLRKELIQNIQQCAPQLKGKTMDFGCGNKPYRSFFQVDEYIGVDLQQTGHDQRFSNIDVYYDGRKIPFANAYFDSILCSEVLEHVFNIDEILNELNRVLKKDGVILLTIPFCWNEHEIPYDFGRYTSFGIKDIMEKHGFEIVYFKKSGNFIIVIFQLLLLYWYEVLKKFGIIGYAITFVFTGPINLLGIIFNFLLPHNDSLYFNNIVVARKKT